MHQHEQRWSPRQRSTHYQLLLVATRQAPRELIGAAGYERQFLHGLSGDEVAATRTNEAPLAQPIGDRHGEVLADAEKLNETFTVAISGNEPDTCSQPTRDVSGFWSHVVHRDRATVGLAQAHDGFGKCDAAAAAATGNADHLAGMYLKRQVVVVTGLGEILDLQYRVARTNLRHIVVRLQDLGFARHRGDELVGAQIGYGRGHNVPCVAKHGDRLADLVDLLKVMADVQKADTLRLQRA